MNSQQPTQKCAHPACKCPAPADKQYCSDYCAQASREKTANGPCQCGHPECRSS